MYHARLTCQRCLNRDQPRNEECRQRDSARGCRRRGDCRPVICVKGDVGRVRACRRNQTRRRSEYKLTPLIGRAAGSQDRGRHSRYQGSNGYANRVLVSAMFSGRRLKDGLLR